MLLLTVIIVIAFSPFEHISQIEIQYTRGKTVDSEARCPLVLFRVFIVIVVVIDMMMFFRQQLADSRNVLFASFRLIKTERLGSSSQILI